MDSLLPSGLDTMVTENGNNLSGGQRQMINNMRALLSDAAIVIFDEPTSALDMKGKHCFPQQSTELRAAACANHLTSGRCNQ